MNRPYPQYRHSGVEWIGKVPGHWEIKRLKWVASTNDDVLGESEDPLRRVAYVDIGSVDPTAGITQMEEMVLEVAPSRARRLVQHGDTIVSTVRTYLRAIAPIRQPPAEMVVSTGFAVVRPRQLIHDFASWALQESGFVDEIVARSVGVSYPAINASEIGDLPLAQPPHNEQRAIAEFLERETAKIDVLVAKKHQLIERLDEYRTALITRTVTRGLPPEATKAAGLDPSPRLKPSGVPWLGEVPEHWEVTHLRRLVKTIKTGTTPPAGTLKELMGDDIAWFSPGDIGSVLKMELPSRTLGDRAVTDGFTPLFPAESTLIVGIGATTGLVGHNTSPSTGNQQLTCIVGNDHVFPRFLSWQLWAHSKAIRAIVPYATLPILNNAFLRSLSFVAPSLREQQAIAVFLDEQTEQIDMVCERVEAAIERLQEYRTALVTAAVTGKIDVRDRVAAGVGGCG